MDLSLLPCEEGDSPIFFRAVEFDEGGQPLFPRQLEELDDHFAEKPVTDLIFFVHGWNKNPSSAESDYQNFLCRLHARLRGILGEESKRRGGLLVAGVFWPSTITNRPSEPALLKPLSYYRIRNRADLISETGVADLLASLTPRLEEGGGGVPIRLHLVGHSFGGRVLVQSLEALQQRDLLVRFLRAAGGVNVVLLNAAIAPSRFDWIREAVASAEKANRPARFTQSTDSYLFNVHSFKDSANRRLFPLASLFNDDPATCAAGACGVPGYPTICVNEAGEIELDSNAQAQPIDSNKRLNAWNVDASRIVFGHTDIYKGRIAALLAGLLYDEEARREFPVDPSTQRCER